MSSRTAGSWSGWMVSRIAVSDVVPVWAPSLQALEVVEAGGLGGRAALERDDRLRGRVVALGEVDDLGPLRRDRDLVDVEVEVLGARLGEAVEADLDPLHVVRRRSPSPRPRRRPRRTRSPCRWSGRCRRTTARTPGSRCRSSARRPARAAGPRSRTRLGLGDVAGLVLGLLLGRAGARRRRAEGGESGEACEAGLMEQAHGAIVASPGDRRPVGRSRAEACNSLHRWHTPAMALEHALLVSLREQPASGLDLASASAGRSASSGARPTSRSTACSAGWRPTAGWCRDRGPAGPPRQEGLRRHAAGRDRARRWLAEPTRDTRCAATSRSSSAARRTATARRCSSGARPRSPTTRPGSPLRQLRSATTPTPTTGRARPRPVPRAPRRHPHGADLDRVADRVPGGTRMTTP